MTDDRTPGELGIGSAQPAMPAGSAAGVPRPVTVSAAAPAAAEQPTEVICQKADWLAETTELPIGAVAARSTPAGLAAEPTADRLRRWGREYGGYVAAGALTALVLTCSVIGLPGPGVTWHSGNPVAAPPSSATGSSSPGRVPSATSAATPSTSASGPPATPSRRPTRRPVAAAEPRRSAPAVRTTAPRPTPTPSPAVLGPGHAAALAGIVDDYCDRRFDRSAVLLRPWRGSGAEDNWACQRRRYDPIMVNMTQACVQRYGRPAVARYLDARDPFSWRCYRD